MGTFGRQLGTQLGGVVGAVASARADRKRAAETTDEQADLLGDGGLAAQITVSPAVIGISAQRVLVFGHSKLSGRPQDLDVAFPLQEIDAVTTEKKEDELHARHPLLGWLGGPVRGRPGGEAGTAGRGVPTAPQLSSSATA